MTAGQRSVDAVAANAVLIAVRQAANLLCDRWSLKILLALTLGARRYGEIRERCGIANRLITGRLRMQEASGMIVRMPYTRRPLRHEYQLTNMGLDLFGVFATMLAWEQRQAIAAAAPRLRVECGACHHAVTPQLHCRACDGAVDARGIDLRVSQTGMRKMPAKDTGYRMSTATAGSHARVAAGPLEASFDIFGDKWTVEVLICAFLRMRSFGDFNSHIGISTNILADRLSRLVTRGLLRKSTAEDSLRSGAYVLTDAGMDAYPILIALQTWADDWVEDRYRSPVRLIHRACGHALVQQLRCDRCRATVDRGASRLVLDPVTR